MAQNPYNEDPELDDILSNIMRPGSDAPVPPPVAHKLPPEPKHAPKKAVHIGGMGSRRRSVFDTPQAAAIAQPKQKKRAKGTKKVRKGFKKFALTALVLAVGAVGGYFLYTGPVSALLSPSPFSKEARRDTPFDLYYPTQLPPGFYIDKKTLSNTMSSVIVYGVTDGKKNIAITMQALPEGLDLKNLLANYKDVKKIQTPVGAADIGIQNGNVYVAHILTPKTWIIMNTDSGTMSRDAFNVMVKSLKQG